MGRRTRLLIVAVFTLAPAGSTVAATPPLTVTAAAEPGSHAAAIAWTANPAARVTVEVGRTGEYGIWARTPRTRRSSGRARIGGLEPATTYVYRLVARRGRLRVETRGSFTTAAFPAWTTGAVIASALHVDGQPFFPRMVLHQCDWAYASSLAAGINLFMGSGCGTPWSQLDAIRARAVSAIPAAYKDVADGRGTIGWYHPDEADLFMPPEALPFHPPWQQTHRVTFLTLSGHVYSGASPPPGGRSVYPRFVARADMIGFDLYPLQVMCRRDAFGAVFDAQRELAAMAGPRGSYQWVEAGRMEFCRGRPDLDPTPATVRAETWLAIAGGARGIGYFPDHWQPGIAGEIARTNVQISALAPALLAPVLSLAPRPSVVRASARRYEGATYVIAVNSSLRRVTAVVGIPNVRTATARVFGEGRAIAVRRGTIVDRFAPLQPHVYIVPP
jgi:hypothetical protein